MQGSSLRSHSRPIFDACLRLFWVAILAIGGCSSFSPGEPELPAGAIPISPRLEFRGWFERTEACSGISGQFQRIQWFVVPGAETFQTSAGPKVGMWEKNGGMARIVIAGRYLEHEMVVRHEMLHHLLDREGHPAEFFVTKCHLTWETWLASSADH